MGSSSFVQLLIVSVQRISVRLSVGRWEMSAFPGRAALGSGQRRSSDPLSSAPKSGHALQQAARVQQRGRKRKQLCWVQSHMLWCGVLLSCMKA